jgi:hypothetical protein
MLVVPSGTNKEVGMTVDANAADEVAHTSAEVAEIKQRDRATDAPPVWQANLWSNVPAAIAYANQNPQNLPGTIIFNIRDNGQVWTYDLH